MSDLHSVLIIAVTALVTMAIRFAPFIIFKKKTPKAVQYLSNVLPCAVIGMLVIYCLKDISFKDAGNWLPQLTAVAITAVVHKIGHKTLLSIIVGTASYMILIKLFASLPV